MLKLVEKVDAKERSQTELRATLQELGKSSNLRDACSIAADYFLHHDHDLVCNFFAAMMTPYLRYGHSEICHKP